MYGNRNVGRDASGYKVGHDQISGIFFFLPNNPTRVPLPLLNITAKATITSTNTHLLLTQTFRVPEYTNITTAKYSFPLYTHSAVSSFTAHIGPTKVLHAKIEKKKEAREQFNAAVAAGQTAALMSEVTSEIFTMELGNLPANTEIKVVLGVIGELKGAGEDDTNGDHTLRYTLPMTIAPKYGAPPAELRWDSNLYQANKQGLQIEVEVLSPETIKGISSPTHPVAVEFGGHTEGGLQKMSATLSQVQSIDLDKDFVLEVKLDKNSDSVKPWAILEKHPTIKGQSAVMVSFLPRLKLRKVKPEVIFVLDRSGSMESHMGALKSAMQVFLKSLSAGVKFNICCFGNRYEFMFPDGNSRDYTEETMEQALNYAAGMTANMGGTELLSALKATLDGRDKNSDTEVIVLTDGDIWRPDTVFNLIREEKDKQAENKKDFRLFSIGLGNGVDRNLVEGMAHAGNGYAIFVGENEAFEGKVVKMLKTALSERLLDMEFKLRDAEGRVLDGQAEESYGYESESTTVDTPQTTPSQSPPKKLSLFQDDASDDELEASPAIVKDSPPRPLTPPNPLRAPYKIESLLPGQRSIFYFLQAPTLLSKTLEPKDIIFTAKTSAGNNLELIIPISKTPLSDNEDISTTIHKLAARRVIKEMEQGSTWIDDALAQQLNIQKKDSPSTHKRYVDQHGEAIAMKWQILSKWTSFIIVDSEGKKLVQEDQAIQAALNINDVRPLVVSEKHRMPRSIGSGSIMTSEARFGQAAPAPPASIRSLFGASSSPTPSSSRAGGGLFGSAAPSLYSSRGGGGLFGSAAPSLSSSRGGSGLFGSTAPSPPASRSNLFGADSTTMCTNFGAPNIPDTADECESELIEPTSSGSDLFGSAAPTPTATNKASPQNRGTVPSLQSVLKDTRAISAPASLPVDPKSLTLALLKLSSFSGAFNLPTRIDLSTFGIDSTTSLVAMLNQKGVSKPQNVDEKEWKTLVDTILVLTILKERCEGEIDVWEMIADKAEAWVEDSLEEKVREGIEKVVKRVLGVDEDGVF